MASYTTAQDSWRDKELIRWLSPTGDFIGEFPFAFLIRCGVDPWEYMLDVLSWIVESDDPGPISILNTDGTAPQTRSSLVPGSYIYSVNGKFRRSEQG